ncbi:GTPase of the mitochondrial inner membrane that associates with the large ribosomal subunit [Coemansia erecta]|uniref:GTPase of the mitochondrial inner membrane that associates with the large ribosomal subunit n=1 Tax=Coemansia erecta TaxID=147472 RepID=A0A9W7Y447_9FUNG|nr:GTPase of the mitochondrial inner membrane that associates with the large ribosomal subunit [Coemansia erecta]
MILSSISRRQPALHRLAHSHTITSLHTHGPASPASPTNSDAASVEWKLRSKAGRNFIDRMRCTAVGGHGGDGCVSFFRDVFVPRGPPNGGDGGHGGSVWLEVDENETSLGCVKQQLRAQAGSNGRGKNMHGAAASDLVVRVPRGTLVREIAPEPVEPQEAQAEEAAGRRKGAHNAYLDELARRVRSAEHVRREDKSSLFVHYPRWEERNDVSGIRLPPEYSAHLRMLREGTLLTGDLTSHGQRLLVAAGGMGGPGNPHFNLPGDRQPHYALRGLAGVTRQVELELKTIADVGLVGMPNAGKSSFLRAVSNAHPRVAPYPFTTLNPYIGSVDYADARQVTVADIPGLIPGAHRNVGLGHAFLRHVERSRMLVFIVDVARPAPWADLLALQHELALYCPGLAARPCLVLANKADAGDRARENFGRWQRCISPATPLIPVSAKYRKNILKATHAIRQMLDSLQPRA